MFAKLSRWFVLLAFGLMIFNVVGQIVAQADDSPAAEIELTGVVEAFDNTTVTINGLVIDITGAELGVALQVGAQVRVHGWIDDGRFIAREINGTLDDDDDDNGNDNNDDNGNDNDDDNGNDNADDESRDEAEIIGVLTEITDTTITVGGVVINIEGAEINDDPVVGEIVRVHVSVNDDGTWVAREVDENIDDDDDDDNSAIIVPEGCLVTQPAGWTTYTIRPGDTLSGIAERTDSSTASLALVNCLFDARVIVAGTTLFVPRAPVAGDDNGNDDDDDGNDNDDDGNDDDDGGNDDDDGGNDNDDDGGNDDDDDDNDDDDGGNDNGDDDDDNGDDDGGNDDDDDDDGGNSGRGGDDDDDDNDD